MHQVVTCDTPSFFASPWLSSRGRSMSGSWLATCTGKDGETVVTMGESRIHALQLCESLAPTGGAALHLRAVLGRGLPGCRVTVAVGRGPLASPGLGVQVCGVSGLGGRLKEQRRAGERVEALIHALNPDVVHLHNLMQPELLRRVGRMRPTVYTLQDHRVFCPGRGKLTAAGAPCRSVQQRGRCAGCFADSEYAERIWGVTQDRRRALRKMGALVVLSSYMKQELVRVGMSPDKVHVIPPFPWEMAPVGPFKVRPGVHILAAGRLVEAKGFHLLLEAYARSSVALPLVIAGRGPYSSRLHALAQRLGLLRTGPAVQRGAHFPGWLPHSELAHWMRSARVLALPSIWAEPFGIVGLEALFCGVPVVGFDVGGVGGWLHEGVGWLVAPGDIDALAGALSAACTGGEALRRGTLGRGEVWSRFQPATLNRALVRLYRSILNGGEACADDDGG